MTETERTCSSILDETQKSIENGTTEQLDQSDLNKFNIDPVIKNTNLKKELKLVDGVTIILISVIGSGIFITPTGVLQHSGSVGQALLIWLLSGIFAALGALSYAELGTTIPKSGEKLRKREVHTGNFMFVSFFNTLFIILCEYLTMVNTKQGNYAYINEAFGQIPSFLYLWMTLFFMAPCGTSILALTTAQYILQPLYVWIYDNEAPSYITVRVCAATLIVFLTLMNCYSVKLIVNFQRIMASSKFFALILIISTGLWHLVVNKSSNLDPQTLFNYEEFDLDIGEITLAFYFGLYSYSGYTALNFVTEEMINPIRDLPRSIFISMPLITTIYVLTNIAYFAVLTPNEMLSSQEVAISFGNKTFVLLATCIPVFVAVSIFGTLCGDIFVNARIMHAAARDGHLPRSVANVSTKHTTPIPALVFQCITSLIVLFCVGEVEKLITYGIFVDAMFTLLTILSLFYVRYKNPGIERPLKINIMVHIIFLLASLALVVIPCILSPNDVIIGVIAVAVGFLVYLITNKWPNKYLQCVSTKFNDVVDRCCTGSEKSVR